MVKFHGLLTSLAMVGIALSATVTTASAASPSERNARSNIQSIDRATVAPTRFKPVAVYNHGIPVSSQNYFSATRIEERPSASKDLALMRRASEAAGIELRGSVTDAANWTYYEPHYGMYNVPQSQGQDFTLIAATEIPLIQGYDDSEGHYYTVYSAFDYSEYDYVCHLATLNTEDWSVISDEILPDKSMYAVSSAYDPTTGNVYACNASASSFNDFYWSTIDYQNRKVTTISHPEIGFKALGCDENGQFYGINEMGRFVKVDKTTGEQIDYPTDSYLPADYFETTGQHGACVDDKGKRFLVAGCNSSTSKAGLFSFDLATGECTHLVDFPNGECVHGLYIPAPPTPGNAPAAPGLTVTATGGGDLKADVTLTIPSVLNDGTPAAGQSFNYTVKLNGQEIKNGEATAGDVVKFTADVTTNGTNSFSAFLSNVNGKSKSTSVSCFIGKGRPAAPGDVTLTVNGTEATLTWSAVTESIDGGFIDPDAITYSIVDSEGNSVADGISGTSKTFTITLPEEGVVSFSYSVIAQYEARQSSATKSNSVVLGSFVAPYDMQFTSTTEALHTIIDANNDKVTWNPAYYGGSMEIEYNRDGVTAMDDWLISPPFKFESGYIYPITVTARCGYYSTEEIEVKIGRGATVADMTTTVIAKSTVNSDSYDGQKFSGTFYATDNGNYNIGIHAISGPDTQMLSLTGYSIGNPIHKNTPAPVEDLKAERDPKGALSATISFTAPSKDLSDQELTGDLNIIIKRDNVEIKRMTVAAGASGQFTDNVDSFGDYAYSAIAEQNGHESTEVKTTAYVGPLAAKPTAKVSLYQIDLDKLLIEWEPVTTDINGVEIPAEDVTYDIYEVKDSWGELYLGDKVNDTPLQVTSYQITRPANDTQKRIYYAVKCYNRGVCGTSHEMGNTIFGDPYDAPVVYTKESDTKERFFAAWGSLNTSNVILGSASTGIPAIDGDDCYIMSYNPEYSDQTLTSTTIQLGRIYLGECSNPTMTLWIYGFGESLNPLAYPDGDPNETCILASVGKTTETIAVIDHRELKDGWNRIDISLEKYADDDIQISIFTICHGVAYALYDYIHIGDPIENDLMASISAPTTAAASEKFNVNATITNLGAKATEPFDVELLCNGKVVDTKKVSTPIEPGRQASIVFDCIMNHDTAHEYSVHAVNEADDDKTNNTSPIATVTRIINHEAVVTGLKGSRTNEGNTLTWDPVLVNTPMAQQVNESFESASHGDQSFGKWLFVDGDQSPIGLPSSLEFDNIKVGVSNASFFAVNGNKAYSPNFYAHTGDISLGATYRQDQKQSDEWLISPRLSGNAQTITFYARNTASYSETIAIYSTTGSQDNLESYTEVKGTGGTVPNEWTFYEVSLPEGTTHFAIRSIATYAYVLLVDDVTFEADNGTYDNLVGYNVYCDGERLNDTPVKETSFTHANPAEHHTYHVTAVYENAGESELSEPAVIDMSGIDDVTLGNINVAVEGGEIVVYNAGDNSVSIHSIDGRTIYSGTGDCRVAVATGSFIVTVGKNSFKTAVR